MILVPEQMGSWKESPFSGTINGKRLRKWFKTTCARTLTSRNSCSTHVPS
ncbi:unnamed protein product, partial [Vitis vinifera]